MTTRVFPLQPQAVHEQRSGAMSIVLALLAFSVFINYVDRGNLSIAAPMLKDELGLTGSQLGILLSSFFWTYGLFQILSGWLVDRFNVNWVMAIGFFLWSAATSATGLLHGFTALLVVRLILGIGESVAYPSYSKILTKYFPESQRGFANSLIASGLASGPAFGMLLGGMLMARFGWRSFFIGVGLVSLLWLLPWFRWMPRGPGLFTVQRGPAPTTLEILKQRRAWGSFIGLFCNAYSLYFLIAWLPFYLVRERHFSMDTMAKIGGAVAHHLPDCRDAWHQWISSRQFARRSYSLGRTAIAGRRLVRLKHVEHLADHPDSGGPARLGTVDRATMRLREHFRRACVCCNGFHIRPYRPLFLGVRGRCCILHYRRAELVVSGKPSRASGLGAAESG